MATFAPKLERTNDWFGIVSSLILLVRVICTKLERTNDWFGIVRGGCLAALRRNRRVGLGL